MMCCSASDKLVEEGGTGKGCAGERNLEQEWDSGLVPVSTTASFHNKTISPNASDGLHV